MLIPSWPMVTLSLIASLSRRVNANSQLVFHHAVVVLKLIKKGEC